MIPAILSIAGSDPSGGAGIQADIKAISANGGYAMAALTALTAQNTTGVFGIETLAPDFVAQQITTVFDDIRVDAVKIGMIANTAIAARVAQTLTERAAPFIVLDPVMVAKGGDRLLDAEAVLTMRTHLLPLASVLTPNLPEAAILLGEAEITRPEDMPALAERLRALGPRAVLLKGGHLRGQGSPDYLMTEAGGTWLEGARIATGNTHGTGCTLSSALATQLALTGDVLEAARAAKAYVTRAIAGADDLDIGKGHGPLHHFA